MSKLLATTFLAVTTFVFPLVLGPGPASADGTPVRVRGTVVSLDGSKLVVHAKDGKDITVSLKDKYAALAVVKSSMDEIKKGTFIGTATSRCRTDRCAPLKLWFFPIVCVASPRATILGISVPKA